ncbi:MAG: GH39 family glycosyl hydrolase [Anaerolineae bacterium]
MNLTRPKRARGTLLIALTLAMAIAALTTVTGRSDGTRADATAALMDAASLPGASLPLAAAVTSGVTVDGAELDAVAPLTDVLDADGRLGACYSFHTVDGVPLPPKAYAAGARWDRFDFRWNAIEDTPDTFEFAPHEEVVARDREHGINVVGILGSTARWAAPGCDVSTAATAPTQPDDVLPFASPMTLLSTDDDFWWRPCPPTNLDLAWNDPANHWGNYVYQTVSHFKDQVSVWEMWNEPDIHDVFWTGTPEQYAQLLKVGYQAAKAANPDATVLFSGLAYWHDPDFYLQVLDALAAMPGAAESNYYFDVMSLHLYSSIYIIRPTASAIQANVAERVGPHPLWLTETGVPVWDEYDQANNNYKLNRATAEEAAAFVIEGYAEARAAGIDKSFFFRTHDDHMTDFSGQVPEYFGLIRDDLTFRPSYVAYQVAARYLQGENQITGPFSHSTTRRITFWGTPRGRIDVLWNTTGAPAAYGHPAVVPTATLVTHHGHTQTLQATGNVFTVTLGQATANTSIDGSYLIGGPPLILIQSDPEPPTSTLRALPTITFGSEIRLTWDVTDTVSGYWYAEVARAPAPTGTWTTAAGWTETGSHGNQVTSTLVGVPNEGIWYFRARVRDRVGNWESWSPAAEVSTTVHLSRPVALSVTTYLDANRNHQWDPGEVTTATTHLAWRRLDGTTITETIGAGWQVTETVEFGDYLIDAVTTDHLPARRRIAIPGGLSPFTTEVSLGLRPVHTRIYAPIVTRSQ